MSDSDPEYNLTGEETPDETDDRVVLKDDATAIITGEGVIYQQQCIMCNLCKDHPDVYKWVKTTVGTGISWEKVRVAYTQYLEQNGLTFQVPARRSIWKHFTKHLSIKDVTEIEIAKQQYNTGINPEDILVSDKVIKELAGGNFDEYRELCALYVKFREVHDKIYHAAGALQTPSSDGVNYGWSQQKISTFVSMINTQKSILAEISKMRQSNKIITIAAQFIVETYTKNIIHKLSEEFSALISIMKRQNIDPEIIGTFEEITSIKLASILISEAEGAMDRTKSEFKIPN